MRWKGNGKRCISNSTDKADIYFSGTTGGIYDCGFVVQNKFRNSVIDWEPMNERLCYLYNYSIICVYALHSDRPESEKDVFYDLLDKTIGNCPKYDAVMVLGDFNAKVGSKSGLKGTVGHSLHREFNKNGVRLTELALSRGLEVSSTRFSHLQIHMGTWKIPGKSRSNQIDHVLMDSRHASCILDIRSCRGANIDSDHYLVKAKVRSRISMARTSGPKVYIRST